MEEQKLRKIKVWLIVCIVILILLVILASIMKKREPDEIRNIGSIEIAITEKSINIENFDEILNELPMKSVTMYNKVQDFALSYLKRVYNSLMQASDNKIKEYYEVNQQDAEKFLYHSNLDNFEKFISQLNQMKSSTLTYVENIFDVDTLKKSNDEYSFQMRIKYQNEDYLTYIVHMTEGEDKIIEENEVWFEPILD